MSAKHYRVGELAALAHTTVRTLHHYDQIGLLRPSGRSARGYRLYTGEDLLRLQQILIGRQFGMALEAIRSLLDDPTFDYRSTLLEQRRTLEQRMDEAQQMIAAIDEALRNLTHQGDDPMNPKQLFDGFDPQLYQDEAQQRWGHTDAYRESARRTAKYSRDDWQTIRAAEADIVQRLARTRSEGHGPDSEAARALAEEYRLHIDRWYYPCSHAMHATLATMYTADPRFAAHFDAHGEGLAEYFAAAIEHNGEASR